MRINYKNYIQERMIYRIHLLIISLINVVLISKGIYLIIGTSILATFILFFLIGYLILLIYKPWKKSKSIYFLYIPFFPFKTVSLMVNKEQEKMSSFNYRIIINSIMYLILCSFLLYIFYSSIWKFNLYLYLSEVILFSPLILFSIIKLFYSLFFLKNVSKNTLYNKIYFYKNKSTEIESKIINSIKESNGILTYKELKIKFKISFNTLSEIIKNNFNMTFKEYSLNLKMSYASKMLNKGKTMDETSIMCGYNSRSSFYKAYNSWTKKQ